MMRTLKEKILEGLKVSSKSKFGENNLDYFQYLVKQFKKTFDPDNRISSSSFRKNKDGYYQCFEFMYSKYDNVQNFLDLLNEKDRYWKHYSYEYDYWENTPSSLLITIKDDEKVVIFIKFDIENNKTPITFINVSPKIYDALIQK